MEMVKLRASYGSWGIDCNSWRRRSRKYLTKTNDLVRRHHGPQTSRWAFFEENDAQMPDGRQIAGEDRLTVVPVVQLQIKKHKWTFYRSLRVGSFTLYACWPGTRWTVWESTLQLSSVWTRSWPPCLLIGSWRSMVGGGCGARDQLRWNHCQGNLWSLEIEKKIPE